MRVVVGAAAVAVRVTVGALHRRLVHMIVVAVVVAVRVLVFERLMHVKVLMLLRDVEVHGKPEERR